MAAPVPPYPAAHGLLDGKTVVVTAAAGTARTSASRPHRIGRRMREESLIEPAPCPTKDPSR